MGQLVLSQFYSAFDKHRRFACHAICIYTLQIAMSRIALISMFFSEYDGATLSNKKIATFFYALSLLKNKIYFMKNCILRSRQKCSFIKNILKSLHLQKMQFLRTVYSLLKMICKVTRGIRRLQRFLYKKSYHLTCIGISL